MELLAPRSQVKSKGLINTFASAVWAVCLVFFSDAVTHHLNAHPSGILLGYAIVVMIVAATDSVSSVIAATGAAALMAAYVLPPANTLGIAPAFRLSYTLFLMLCALIIVYRPPRSSMPPAHTANTTKTGDTPYTEADLPTIVPSNDALTAQGEHVISGAELYQWERSCAHLSDLLWDAQIKLHERDTEQAKLLLQYAYDEAAQTRRRIREAGSSPPA